MWYFCRNYYGTKLAEELLSWVKAVSKDNVVDKIVVVVLAIPRGGITFSHSWHPLHPVLMFADFEKAIIYMVNPNPTKSNSKLHFVAILKVFLYQIHLGDSSSIISNIHMM